DQRMREIAAARLAGAGLGNIKADVHGSLFLRPGSMPLPVATGPHGMRVYLPRNAMQPILFS
ncbi:MAG: hypothetical protein WA108_01275, partial [Thiobacillus sp.]